MLDPLTLSQPIMLDVGAGGFSNLKGFTSVDLYTQCDINAPMWEIPLPDGSVDVIVCLNALEHVQRSLVVPTIREFNRLLKVGGKIEIMIPDLEWSCQWFLDHPTTGWNMDIIYGNQNHGGEFHLTGFTRDIIADYFKESVEDKITKWYIEGIDYLFGDIVDGKVTQRVIVVRAEKI